MADVLTFTAQVARTRIPVLITGETGTGKEMVARHIHRLSGRTGQFVPIDCTALPTELMESELFGHERGAFTGALVNRPGLLEAAIAGTAFFDEIGDLPFPLQAKLLRVLDRQEFRAVGSNAYRKVEFRILAATNRDLRTDVAQGRFREDLYYRLAGTKLYLPPLRERREDVVALASSFAGRPLPPEMLEWLVKYDWPGNVRQLRHCAKCVAEVGICPLKGDTGPHPACDIVEALRFPNPGRIRKPPTAERTHMLATMEERERLALAEALAVANGSRGGAAALLGIGRTTLYRRMKRYGTTAPQPVLVRTHSGSIGPIQDRIQPQ